jgi:sec-independent protein translocase protein TatB
MIDFGFDKIALIGAVALIVLGPEKLPRVARTVGHFLGKAQRYVADVKAEVNRSIELEALQKMKDSVQDAARDVRTSLHETSAEIQGAFNSNGEALSAPEHAAYSAIASSITRYVHPKKQWRARRTALPVWYKQRHGVRARVQSGAARVARFRPVRPAS